MNVLRKIIIALFIFIIVLIFILMFFIKHGNENETEEIENNIHTEIIQEQPIEEVFDENNKIQKITLKAQYFNVKECIEKYKTYLLDLKYNDQKKDEYKKQISLQQIKSIIPDFVIEKLNITDENLLNKIGIPDSVVKIDCIYRSKQTLNEEAYIEKTNISAYIALGQLINPNNSSQTKDFKIIIILDEKNMSFMVIPQEYIDANNINIEEGKNLILYQEDAIPVNEYNRYVFSQKTEADLALEFFNLSRYYLDFDIDYMYNKMSEEYRNKRFGSIDEYREYIRKNYTELKNANAEEYLRSQNGKTPQYIIKDQYQNLYIFDAQNPLDYTIKLDTYTLDEEKFITEYNKASVSQKVQMNIDKFFQMINRHDYRTSYNCLATSFKNKNNITIETFENMAKSMFWDYNKINFIKFEEVGNNVYVYNISLTDLTETQSGAKNVEIVMKLKDSREFEMSFSSEN